MKGRLFSLVLFLMLFSIGNELFAFGRRQAEEEVEPINPEWILCITEFDVSTMSMAWQTAGDITTRSLLTTLRNLGFRFRSEGEINFYRDFTWANNRANVARELAARQNARDLLIFRGDPEWRYERNIRTIDEEIAELKEQLREIDELAPVVEGQPIFLLCENNRNGIFPEPPIPGGEFHFTSTSNIDAFVTGSFTEFRGRIFLEVKMFTRHTNSYSYEDSVLFSSDDFNMVVAEVSDRLAAAVSVIHPSTVVVRSEQPDAMILIDGSFLPQDHARIFSPGTVEVSAYAPNHYPVTYEMELNTGEHAEIFINLTPFALSAFEIDVSDHPGSRVFSGSLYMGEAPLVLDLPVTEYSYVSVVSAEDEVGTGIFRDNSFIRGSVHIPPEGLDEGRVDFFTMPPIHKEDQKVEDARRLFYRSWGAFWIALPISLLTAGIASNHITANNYARANGLHFDDPSTRQQLNNRASFGNFMTYAGYAAIGGTLGYTVYNIFRYLRASSGDATPIAIVPEPEPDPEPEEEEEGEDCEEEDEDCEEEDDETEEEEVPEP